MTGTTLRKGENVALPDGVSTVKVVVGWAEDDGRSHDVDGSALLLTSDRRVRSNEDFVFYNQPSAAEGAVQHLGRSVTTSGREEGFGLDLEAVPAGVEIIAITASIGDGAFGDLSGLRVTLADSTTELARFEIDDASSETAFVFGEIYQRSGRWKVRAVGQGWDTGLAGLATDFGVTVDDSEPDEAEGQPSGDQELEPAHDVGFAVGEGVVQGHPFHPAIMRVPDRRAAGRYRAAVTETSRRAQSYDDDLRLAHVICDQVDALTTERFKAQDLRVETKPDLTPVTDADRSAEEIVRSQLRRTRPRDAVSGEEMESTGHGRRRWVVDPIDGTKNFVRGVPVWATLLALLDDDVPVLGVVSAPALGRRWWAATGSGAWTGRSLSAASRLHVSSVTSLADASLSYSSLTGWEERGQLDDVLDLLRSCWRTRAYGDFYSYVLLAEGAVDVACEPELELHDMAALVPIVTEAGGRFTSLSGQDGPFGGNALATNGHLHTRALAALNRSSSHGASSSA